MKQDLTDLADLLAESWSTSLAMPLFIVDELSAQKIIDALMLDKRVAAVRVKNYDGMLLERARDDNRNVIRVFRGISENCLLKAKDILLDNEKLGTIEVYVTSEFGQKELDDSVVSLFAAFIVLDILLFSILFFSIRRWVLFPVRRAISGINKGADEIFCASKQVMSASQFLAEGTSEQAAAGEEIASALEDVSHTTRLNSESSARAEISMKEAGHIVEKADGLIRWKKSSWQAGKPTVL